MREIFMKFCSEKSLFTTKSIDLEAKKVFYVDILLLHNLFIQNCVKFVEFFFSKSKTV